MAIAGAIITGEVMAIGEAEVQSVQAILDGVIVTTIAGHLHVACLSS